LKEGEAGRGDPFCKDHARFGPERNPAITCASCGDLTMALLARRSAAGLRGAPISKIAPDISFHYISYISF
jgi:hypothetical protein